MVFKVGVLSSSLEQTLTTSEWNKCCGKADNAKSARSQLRITGGNERHFSFGIKLNRFKFCFELNVVNDLSNNYLYNTFKKNTFFH